MKSITATELRSNLREALDEVVEDLDYMVINRPKGNVVLISEEEFNSWQETSYLMSSPKNAKRLMEGINDVNQKSKIESHDINEIDDIFS